ncbi:MAG TPA: bifunctional demethylmenaquinone methyltransferase/2-methoxy-6-polyprenyl-1,4-benzoquinol methylase UbiE [Nitrolancea sp.]|nr:bifunctional demethylmenaquinone methyltransferase/2-methoxy-6-polyprenyl-1,4-benzoquinol methylase UbiE [Nitrolancea sp.]
MAHSTTNEQTAGAGALRRPDEIQSMFDRIVGRYDIMNRLMTGGMDVRWRREAAQAAIGDGATHVLDLASGTGDLALELAHQGVPLVVGADFSGEMLRAAGQKLAQRHETRILLARADAMRLPFADGTFEAVTVAFGLRNMPDYSAAIAEMVRVLQPSGRLVILEMTPLRQPLLNRLFSLYFARAVPLVGGLLSGDRDAYRYLPNSVNAFPPAAELAIMMRRVGLQHVRFKLFSFGTVALHRGVKR